VGPARRRRVRELAYGVGDAAPYCRAVVIVLRRKLLGAGGAFVEGLLAITLEHQARGTPDVDFGYHGPRLSPIGERSRGKTLPRPSDCRCLRFVPMVHMVINLLVIQDVINPPPLPRNGVNFPSGFQRFEVVRISPGAFEVSNRQVHTGKNHHRKIGFAVFAGECGKSGGDALQAQISSRISGAWPGCIDARADSARAFQFWVWFARHGNGLPVAVRTVKGVRVADSALWKIPTFSGSDVLEFSTVSWADKFTLCG
jgi:hypothetical protein